MIIWLLITAGWVGAAILTTPLFVREIIDRPSDWKEEAETMDWAFGLFSSLLAWPLILFIGALIGTVKKVAGVKSRKGSSK